MTTRHAFVSSSLRLPSKLLSQDLLLGPLASSFDAQKVSSQAEIRGSYPYVSCSQPGVPSPEVWRKGACPVSVSVCVCVLGVSGQDQAHRCFGEGPKDKDFIVSVPLPRPRACSLSCCGDLVRTQCAGHIQSSPPLWRLGALPAQLAQVLLDRFLLESLGSFGQPVALMHGN